MTCAYVYTHAYMCTYKHLYNCIHRYYTHETATHILVHTHCDLVKRPPNNNNKKKKKKCADWYQTAAAPAVKMEYAQ